MNATNRQVNPYVQSMQPYAGEIRLFAGTRAPAGWLICRGQLEPVSFYPELFAVIGKKYGGDGVNTFGLPDLSVRVPVGRSGETPPGLSKTYPQGAAGGLLDVVLDEAHMPSHTHTWFASKAVATTGTPSPDVTFATVAAGSTLYSRNAAPVTQATAGEMNIASPGGASHPNVMPSVALNYIICVDGLPPETP